MARFLLAACAVLCFFGNATAADQIAIVQISTDTSACPFVVEVDTQVTGTANTNYKWTLIADDGTNQYKLVGGDTITTDGSGHALPFYKSNASGLKIRTNYTFTASLFAGNADPLKDKPLSTSSKSYTIRTPTVKFPPLF